MGTTQKSVKTVERWQGYHEDGDPIDDGGLTIRQATAGALHGAAHMWIWRKKNGKIQILLQKRASNSKTWPNYLDVSAAGHINIGEMPIHAALRETKEELGMVIPIEDVKILFIHRQKLAYEPANIIENELQWVYGYNVTNTPHFQLEADEVNSIVWVSIAVFARLVTGKVEGVPIVPHDATYFAELKRELMEDEG